GAKRIGFKNSNEDLLVTAAENPDGSIATIIFNQGDEPRTIELSLGEKSTQLQIGGEALQTIVIKS
ncbi:MAG: glycosyl hydrolase family 30, partial [Winogradskyella sp.]|nr:glycosyl hydrolase family 30 [Winogradskyella sp.]